MNTSSTLTLSTTVADTSIAQPVQPNQAKPITAKPITAKPITFAQVRRTLARKWDMIAVIGLMVSSAVYGVYALTQMTGF